VTVGAEARYVAADVASADGLAATLRSATGGWGPVTAFVHGAGALADRLVEDKTEADFEAVFGPKVDGLRNLIDVLDTTALRRLVLFASLAGVTGNPGQADYAMANAVLDAYAHELARRLPQCQVVAFDWGPWDGGMVTPAVRERFAERGIAPIALDAGARMLADELTRPPGPPVQVLAGNAPELAGTCEASLRVRVRVTEPALAMLEDHRVAGRAVVPAAWAGAWLAGVAQRLRPELRLAAVEDFQVLKGIAPDRGPLDFEVEVQELTREPDRSVLEAWIRSPDPAGGVERPRFRGRVVLGALPPVPPRVPPPDPEAALEGAEELYLNGPIAYGPGFATVRRVLALDERRVVTECVLPDPPAVPPGPTSEPYVGDLADVATHGILIWLERFRDAACLPASTAVITFYRPPPRGDVIFVTLEVGTVDDTAVTFGYTAHDRDGLAYLRGEGLRMTLLAHPAVQRGDREDEASPTPG
jgi:NAD(P)-dependent dehydrogenase (short-subunit alcohol dehydrogenase family)